METNEINGREADRRVRRCLGSMLGTFPFFATLAMHTPLTARPDRQTVACDGESLFYNPKWVMRSTSDDIKAAISRVVLACALKHHTRRGSRSYKRWQMASQLATQPLMHDAGLSDVDGEDISVEDAYDMLPEDPDDDDDKQQQQQGQGGEQGEGQPSCDPGGKGEVMDSPAAGKDALSGAAQEEEQKWDDMMHQSAQMAKAVGKLPGKMGELIEGAHESDTDWRTLLQRFMSSVSATDYTWRRPNRRLLGSGLYLPSLRNEAMPPVVIAIDTSGSMSEPELARVWDETVMAVRETNPESVIVIQCDSEIQAVDEFAPDDIPGVDFIAKGRGGTALEPVFEEVARMDSPPACLIYFSDMEVWSWPDEPEYPVLWVRIDEGRYTPEPPPWGEYIEVPALVSRARIRRAA